MPRLLLWLVAILSLAISPPPVYGGSVFEGTPPPDPSNRTAMITNPQNLSATTTDPDDWYIADHPFFYLMDKVRAPNGSWVSNPNASIPPFTVEEWRKHTMERVPWWIRWYVTGETRALRKEMLARRKTIIDHVVSPMDWGRSLRAQSVRAQWHEQLRHFWTEALGYKVWRNLKHNVNQILFGGMQTYIDAELYRKKFASMNSTEWGLYNNMSMDEIHQIQVDVTEQIRWKLTRPYRYKMPTDLSDQVQRLLPDVKVMVQHFQPYVNYTRRYYNAEDHDLPPPTMPAAVTYPWPWANRIAQLRATLVEVMRIEAARNHLADKAQAQAQAQAGVSTEIQATGVQGRRRLQGPRGSSSGSSSMEESEAGVELAEDGSGSGSGSGEDGLHLDDDSKMAAMQQLKQLANEFHFTSGLPRIDMMKDRYAPTLFPTLHQFLNLSIDANGSVTVGSGETFPSAASEPEAGDPGTRNQRNTTTDASSREGVYTAAQSFYSFATVESKYIHAKDHYKPATPAPTHPTDGTMLVDDLTQDEKIELVDCSAASPCIVRSGVTVYTPKVASAVHDLYMNISSVSSETQQLTRLDWIMNVFQEAFDAERRVISSGLQAPSTVWNSYFDRTSDILADTVLGLVNGTKAVGVESGAPIEPRAMFELLTQNNTSSPLANSYSHFRMMTLRTRNAMADGSVPALVPFTSDQLLYLVAYLLESLKEIEKAVDHYQRTRDADRMHVAIVNATKEEVYYDGRLFGVLGYGYFLPATNAANVAYRDHKIPVPYHLMIRILIRLQESHLMLPDESVHLAACVAMLQFDVRYYRCNEMKVDERATPRPMQEEPESPSPPSRTMASLPSSTTTMGSGSNITTAQGSNTLMTLPPTVVPQRPSPHIISLEWS